MFRKCTATILLLAISTSASAQASSNQTAPSITYSAVQYPASAISAREGGVVLVDAEIDASGHASNTTVERSSGYQDLDVAALQSILHWSFIAGTVDGKPEPQWIHVPIYFDLNNRSTGVAASSSTSLMAIYAAAIQNQVSAHWWRPKNLPQQPCAIEITQLPGGQIIHTEIQPGCPYDEAGKQSLVNAVVNASPLPYKGFERVFQKTIHFTFMP
jgi:TonB family protein